MLYIQEYLKDHTLDELKNEFDIRFKLYDDRVCLKYGVKSPKTHPIVRECRGLILSYPDFKVLSRPFDRFFNYGEGSDHLSFNWDKSIVFEKLDGSLTTLYHDGDKWCVSTSGTAFAEGETPLGNTYYKLFLKAIGKDKLNHLSTGLNEEYTHIFELTSPENRIVTPYSETSVTLLAIRHNKNGKYLHYGAMETVRQNFLPFAKKVKSYDLNDPEDIIGFVESRDQFDEGVVCYDTVTQNRIKIKNSSYVSIHHLRGNEVTKKSIINLLLKSEMDEYLTYFPSDIDLMKPYIDKFNNLKNELIEIHDKYKDIEEQKEFALKVKDYPYSGFLFQLRKGKTLDEIFCVDNLNFFVKLIGDENET